MPKTNTRIKHSLKSSVKTAQKTAPKKEIRPPEEDKIIEIDLEEKIIDPELIIGEESEEELEEDAILDEEEVDPFKDKWEE